MYTDLHVQCPLFLSYLKKKLNIPDRFSNNSQVSNLIKIRPVGAELFLADGQTDMAKSLSAILRKRLKINQSHANNNLMVRRRSDGRNRYNWCLEPGNRMTNKALKMLKISDSYIAYTPPYVHGSVHRESMSIIVQRAANIYIFIIFLQTDLHVSVDTLIHHQEHTQTVITTSGTGRTVFATVR